MSYRDDTYGYETVGYDETLPAYESEGHAQLDKLVALTGEARKKADREVESVAVVAAKAAMVARDAERRHDAALAALVAYQRAWDGEDKAKAADVLDCQPWEPTPERQTREH
jgi:hypothetical protein